MIKLISKASVPALLLSLLCLVARAETLVLVAGGGTGGDGGAAADARLDKPFAVGADKQGNLYFPEWSSERIRKIDAKGILGTFAGMGPGNAGYAGDGGPALQAKISWVHNLLVAPDGAVYIADTKNCAVRKIDPATGLISTFAGIGTSGNSGDGGPANKAAFGNIYCIALTPDASRMYLVDLDNKRIRAIDMKNGIVSPFAGTGEKGAPKDGADAVNSPLLDPRAVAADANGNVYILERGGNCLRAVDAHGKIRTVAGTGKKGHSGDGGDALIATLAGPKHLCVDLNGSVIIADSDNHAVRRYSPKDGKMYAVAGTGKPGSAGLNGPPQQVQLNMPHGVYVDAAGTLFIADSMNDRILKLQK